MALPPSAVRVEVLAARGLAHKGKSAFNAFVTMQLTNGGKKFTTATVNHSSEPVWEEECRLPVTGMDADLMLTIQHRNKFGLEEFLGMIQVPLSKISSLSSWAQWVDLEGKGGNKEKKRGSLKVKINFIYDMIGGGSGSSSSTPTTSKASHVDTSPGGGSRLSVKAKSMVKGLSGALHHNHGRDKSSAPGHKSKDHQAVPEVKKKLSVDDVMQDLRLDDSMELEQSTESGTVIPRSATYEVSTGNKDQGSEESTGSNWSKRSLKMRRRLSLPSVNSGSNRGSMSSVAAINEVSESPGATRRSPPGSGESTPAPDSSPMVQNKHRRINTIAQSWLSRSRSSSDSTMAAATAAAAAEEELITHGNFAALSKPVLIKVAGRQYEELQERQEELTNLRGYIDAVLTRVIEHNPELLVNLSSPQHSRAEQHDGRGGYLARRPLIHTANASDSGCGSGGTSPERFAHDDNRPVRYRRSASSPITLTHLRTSSTVSTSSDHSGGGGKEAMLQGSLSESLGTGRETSYPAQSTSSSSSLIDSGSLPSVVSSTDPHSSSPLKSSDPIPLQSARYRPSI